MVKNILSLIPLLFIMHNLFAQSYLFESGQNGANLGVVLAPNENSILFAGSPSYTINGKVTFGLWLGVEDGKDSDFSSTLINPFIEYVAIKQGEKDVPVNVSFGAGFQYNTFKDIDDLTSNTISFNCEISHVVQTKSNLKIIPYGDLYWTRSKYSLKGYGNENYSRVGFSVGGSLVIDKFYIIPAIRFEDGNSNFRVYLGMIFPQ